MAKRREPSERAWSKWIMRQRRNPPYSKKKMVETIKHHPIRYGVLKLQKSGLPIFKNVMIVITENSTTFRRAFFLDGVKDLTLEVTSLLDELRIRVILERE